MTATIALVLFSSVLGSLVSSVLACIPGLHVYSVMGFLAIRLHFLASNGPIVPAEILVPFAVGMVVGYSVFNTLPSVLLAAPDDSALFTVLPGQKYLMNGRGYEGTMITVAGGLAGLVLLVFGFGPLAPRLLPVAKAVFQPHTHWVLWCVICFMLMSEWPKEGRIGWAGWRRFADAWKSLGAGLLTFALSGLLGFLLLYRSPISAEVAFQNLMPAFVGLFTMPWLIMNIASRVRIPAQVISRNINAASVLRGAFAGCLGGGFAAFFPVITGGVGGFLAGHATAIRDDRVFLASQGASKLVYYVGALLLFFVPGVNLTRGGAAWLIKGIYTPQAYHDYYMTLAAIAIAGATAFLVVEPLTRAMLILIGKYDYRRLSYASLVFTLVVVFAMTGCHGMFVMAVSAGIGLIPPLYGARRMNCLAVILLPMACNMSGIGAKVAGLLGLI